MIEEEVLYKDHQGYVGYYYDDKLGHILTCKLSQWSVGDFKKYLVIWGRILNNLRSRGIDHVYGLCSTDKDKKFNEVFGFVDTGGVVRMVEPPEERIIMKLVL